MNQAYLDVYEKVNFVYLSYIIDRHMIFLDKINVYIMFTKTCKWYNVIAGYKLLLCFHVIQFFINIFKILVVWIKIDNIFT